MNCAFSLGHVGLFSEKDVMLQTAGCSFDVHLQEILGGLLAGASLVMLCPQGNMNFEYMVKVLLEKQVSYMQSVPAYLSSVLEYLRKKNYSKFSSLRTIDVGGKYLDFIERMN